MILNKSVTGMSVLWLVALGVILAISLPVFADIEVTTAASDSSVDELSTVLGGMNSAYSAVKTAKGSIVRYHYSKSSKGRELEIKASCKAVFAWPKFKITTETEYLKNDPDTGTISKSYFQSGTKLRETVAFDGQKVIAYNASKKSATLGNVDSEMARSRYWPYSQDYPMQGHGLYSIDPKKSRAGSRIQITGREKVGEDECIVVEKAIGILTQTVTTEEYFVNPTKGYTVPKFRIRIAVTGRDEFLWKETTTEFKDYGNGVWGPSKSVTKEYGVTEATKGQLMNRTAITNGPDFHVNIPVTEEDFVVDLPQGTAVYDEMLGKFHMAP